MSRYFRHFKGDVYEMIGEGLHSETQDCLVAYRKVHPYVGNLWFRPREMFYGKTEAGVRRFTPITPTELFELVTKED